MRYCIYYKNFSENLKFTKMEHVIPAGLGGIAKLPIGYVSDSANELFSSTEREVLRNSILSVNRENVGPGKRGSMNVKKVKSPNIRVLKDKNDYGDNFKLGFIFAGETYMIPQLVLDFNDKELYYTTQYLSTVLDENYGKQTINNFRANLIRFLLDKNRIYKLIEMPFQTTKHFIIIGLYRKRWFAATSHKIINMNYLSLMLLEHVSKEKFNKEVPVQLPKLKQHYTYKFEFNASALEFIYVKTAFNALALFKGNDFVCREIFDPVRNSILNKRNFSDFIMDSQEPNIAIIETIKKIPERNHYVIISQVENVIVAYVSFYKEKKPFVIKLTDNFNGEFTTDGLICDWKNRMEFRIEQLD